ADEPTLPPPAKAIPATWFELAAGQTCWELKINGLHSCPNALEVSWTVYVVHDVVCRFSLACFPWTKSALGMGHKQWLCPIFSCLPRSDFIMCALRSEPLTSGE